MIKNLLNTSRIEECPVQASIFGKIVTRTTPHLGTFRKILKAVFEV